MPTSIALTTATLDGWLFCILSTINVILQHVVFDARPEILGCPPSRGQRHFPYHRTTIIALWLTVFFNALSDFRSIFVQVYNLGLTLGQTAIILYAITLIPGIITRLQWFPAVTQPISSLILPFRRHFGILMFLTSFLHLSFTTTLPYFAAHDFSPPGLLPKLATFQWMGLFGWLALLPLWLTSNDYAQKGLGKFWKILHRLTYVALFFIFLHVAMQGVIWMYVIGPFLLLEVISWLVYWRREATKPKVSPTAQPAAPQSSPPMTPPSPPSA